ncbi:MAG: 2OG-Fe dioxygenase family protein [Burkholderiaceae bacterium]|nr:2OG-Fe dioxygenase family protein [Burkholderiaceae bacterium]
MTIKFSPPYIALEQVVTDMQNKGYAVLSPGSTFDFLGCKAGDVHAWLSGWDHLPIDGFLKDGGRYRRRRHSCFVVDGQQVRQTPHRAHWQPLEYNALHGGMQRLFEPMAADIVQSPAWATLLARLGQLCTQLKPDVPTWFVEAHQFRIDTTDGIGRPTPEGAHRDGVDFVFVLLMARHGVKGGESRVFEIEGPAGQRFTMSEPWTLLLLDDERVIHESTPIQPVSTGGAEPGYRDTLVLTYRARAFQDEAK